MREARHFTNRPSELRGYARIPEVMPIPNRTMQVKRVQRKRTKGWEMPPNTVYVGRPSKWGNPYRLGERFDIHSSKFTVQSRAECIRLYELYLRQRVQKEPDFLDELEGKDLACWCPLDKACHADVILKILSEVSK